MTGKPVESIKELDNVIETENITYFLDPDGAETFPMLLARASRVLDYMNKKHPDETAIMVTHGDIGKMIKAVHDGLGWQEGLMSGYFGNAEAIILENKQ